MLVFNPEYIDRPPERLPRLGVLLLLLWITLPLAFALPVGVIIVFGVLWLIQLGLTLIGSRGLPAWATAIGGLAVFGFVFSQLGTFLGSEGGSALLLLLVLLKTYESRVLRDWHMLLTAMVFLMGATVLLNQGMFIGLWLLAGLFGTATCIALFNMPLRLAARHAATALLLTLPLAAVLFIAVPRMSEPLWRIPQPPKPDQAQTGLSDTMQPGSISNLVQSNELAFNATFDEGYTPNPADLYWRAITMSQFDGEQWRADDDELPTRADTAYTQTIVSYSIIMRDEQGRIPVLDYPIINFNTDNARSKMRFAEGHTIRVRSHDGLRRFVLRAAIGNRLPEKLSPSRQRQLSRLPGYSNQRIRSLARQLRSQSANTVDFVNRTLAYYRNQSFAYTLNPPLDRSPDRIDNFVFDNRRGFCEHYAESFVVIMRAAGVPARVVTGYQGGEYNPDGGFWQVRGKDAHAWAEVWLPEEEAWLRVDPTAAVSSNRIEQGLSSALESGEQELVAGSGNWQWWSKLSAEGQFYWQQWVVNYDSSSQQSLFRSLGLGGFNLLSLLAFLLVGGTLAVIPLWLWWRRSSRRYANLLEEGFARIKERLLDVEGIDPAALGPAETANILREQECLSPELENLLAQYERWNYADDGLPPKAAQKRWYRQCCRAVRKVKL
ncbi:hypothetical protein HMPREF1177_00882 [Eikenella corrodens CC92I]|uniref:Transglutaminase-like domain-containing protein n=2 Tax=Eikenella corrodens TaxID=539 RepID=V7IED4_EIKCO|nr:hypothetical protein HMPREF1177_00882 [Eikenella corrodens CC92I]